MDSTPVSLLQRLRQPPADDAWRRFVELYTPLLYYWACRWGLSNADAADLVQDVFLLLLRKMPEFEYDPNHSFRSWLRTVMANKLNEQKRRARLPLEPDDAALAQQVTPDGIDDLAEAEYRRHLTVRTLKLMEVEFRPATWRACWEVVVNSRPADAVAAELGMSVGAVYAAKTRVLRRLRQELDGLLS